MLWTIIGARYGCPPAPPPPLGHRPVHRCWSAQPSSLTAQAVAGAIIVHRVVAKGRHPPAAPCASGATPPTRRHRAPVRGAARRHAWRRRVCCPHACPPVPVPHAPTAGLCPPRPCRRLPPGSPAPARPAPFGGGARPGARHVWATGRASVQPSRAVAYRTRFVWISVCS